MTATLSRAVRALPLLAMLLPATASAQWVYATNYPPYPASAPDSDLHILVKPREASVYVDGYYAGVVDDFDGTFQRLHITPGQHEIVIYLRGYQSLTRRLYLEPGRKRLIEGVMEPLAAGEAQDPEPVPTMPPPPPDDEFYGPERGARTGPPPGRRPMPEDPGYPPPAPPRDRPEAARRPEPPPPPPLPPSPSEPSRFGTVAIRVQPAGVTILIDGERWEGPNDFDDRMIVQLPVGHHKVEAEKKGYRQFITEIDISADRTSNLTISMARD